MVGRFAGNAGAELILSPIHRNRFLLAYIQVGKEFFICLIWLHYSFLYLLYWAKLDFIHLVCIFICATKAEEPLSVPQYHINPCPAVSLMHHAEAAAAAALVSSSRSCLHTNKVTFLSYANQTKLTLHHYNCFYWLFYHNCQILDINIYIKADKWSRRAVYLSFLDLSSDVKEIDPLTSWKIVSPCPMVRCGGGCCCCWARRCFCLADWRHMVIISVHASIFARHSSRTSLAFLAPRGSRKIKKSSAGVLWARGGRSAGVMDPKWSHLGGDSGRSAGTLWVRSWTAPPAGTVLIGPYTPCALPPPDRVLSNVYFLYDRCVQVQTAS